MTLCGIVRDEGPYLLEWIAWYKLLGVQQIVIYDNESRDESVKILPALQRAGEIALNSWPDRAGEAPQIPAYRDAIRRCSTEWIAFLDVDEFVVLHQHPDLPALLGSMSDECSAIAFNQRFFGSSGLQSHEDRLVIERFIRTAPPGHPLNQWIKTVARAERIKEMTNPHGVELASGYYADPGGRPQVIESYCRSQEVAFCAGQYNHYILKSRNEYLRKQARGQATSAPADPHKYSKYNDRFFAAHDQNQLVDTSAAQKAPAVRDEFNRLREFCRD